MIKILFLNVIRHKEGGILEVHAIINTFQKRA